MLDRDERVKGRERLELRHRIHVVVRQVIARWNIRTDVLNEGQLQTLATEITEALMPSEESMQHGHH